MQNFFHKFFLTVLFAMQFCNILITYGFFINLFMIIWHIFSYLNHNSLFDTYHLASIFQALVFHIVIYFIILIDLFEYNRLRTKPYN